MKKAYYSDYIYYESKIVENSWLLVHGNTIFDCVKTMPSSDEYELNIYKDTIIFPGLINTHTHSSMVYLRGLADDMPLIPWLKDYIWPVEKTLLTEEFIKDASLHAAAEMIKSGTVCANDMYFFVDKTADVFSQVGLRAVIGCGIMDGPLEYSKNFLAKADGLINKYKSNELIDIALCPHAPYSVSTEIFRQMVDFSLKHDTIIHTHLAESLWEYNEIKSKYNMTPTKYLDSIGLFDCKSIFAHCVFLDDEDIKILGDKKVNISHCIQSNLKLASGFSPIPSLMESGANITIGTDGAASNNDLDMISEMSTVALVHKAYKSDATVVKAEDVLKFSTLNAAKALGLKRCGELKKDNLADFIVIDCSKPNMQPLYNPISLLVYSASSANIKDVFVNGRQLLKDGELLTIDIEQVINKSKFWKEKIVGVLGS